MEGGNMFRCNEATMVKIIQHYFDTVLFKEGQSPKVTSVDTVSSHGSTEFEIYILGNQEVESFDALKTVKIGE